MPYAIDPDLIWIRDVPKEYDRSDAWVYQRIQEGKLHKHVIDGDKHTYVRRSEIEVLLQPQRIENPQPRAD